MAKSVRAYDNKAPWWEKKVEKEKEKSPVIEGQDIYLRLKNEEETDNMIK